jgi:hypothetical protein
MEKHLASIVVDQSEFGIIKPKYIRSKFRDFLGHFLTVFVRIAIFSVIWRAILESRVRIMSLVEGIVLEGVLSVGFLRRKSRRRPMLVLLMLYVVTINDNNEHHKSRRPCSVVCLRSTVYTLALHWKSWVSKALPSSFRTKLLMYVF